MSCGCERSDGYVLFDLRPGLFSGHVALGWMRDGVEWQSYSDQTGEVTSDGGSVREIPQSLITVPPPSPSLTGNTPEKLPKPNRKE